MINSRFRKTIPSIQVVYEPRSLTFLRHFLDVFPRNFDKQRTNDENKKSDFPEVRTPTSIDFRPSMGCGIIDVFDERRLPVKEFTESDD